MQVRPWTKEAGGNAICVQADVADEADVARLFQETMNSFGEVNVLGRACSLVS